MKGQQSSTVRNCIKKSGLKDGDDLNTILSALKKAAKLNPEPLIFSGDVSKVQQAIDEGVDVNGDYSKGHPLTYYCIRDNYDIVKLLIDNGANVNIGRGTAWNPLYAAARDASPEVVKLLLKNGADANILTKDGVSPIISAVHSDNATQVLKLLIKAGADVNHVNKYGMTALKLAHGDKEIEQILIKAGAIE